jgi:hypothetical protein
MNCVNIVEKPRRLADTQRARPEIVARRARSMRCEFSRTKWRQGVEVAEALHGRVKFTAFRRLNRGLQRERQWA